MFGGGLDSGFVALKPFNPRSENESTKSLGLRTMIRKSHKYSFVPLGDSFEILPRTVDTLKMGSQDLKVRWIILEPCAFLNVFRNSPQASTHLVPWGLASIKSK